MQHKPAILTFILCFLLHSMVGAQSVLYSSVVSNGLNIRFEVIGKAGNFYWLYKTRTYNNYKNGVVTWPPREERSFEVYDERLTRVKEIATLLSDSVLKEYLIPQRACFDQVIFKQSVNKTSVVVNRFAPDGTGAVKNAHLFDFPRQMELEDILVTRSPDQTKILVLGFVRTDVTPDLYARVYTGEWELLYETLHKGGSLLQPFIQYSRTEYVRESSDVSPIKILNSGDWLMVTPARFKNNFVLCHFKMGDSSFVQVDVGQSRTANIEYCSLSAEEGKDVYIGMLENLSPTDKKVRIMQYSLAQSRWSNDTAYSFHLPNAFKNEEYQFEEEFIQLPGKGFMYLKEYGRSYFIDNWGEQVMLDDERQYAAYTNRASKLKFNEDEYTRNSNLSEAKKRFERGDLSLKYFPFQSADSCWGGLIHVEQATALRYADLSYACVSSGDKIIFLYNSLAKNLHKVSNTLMLNKKGQPLDEGVIFWRSDNIMNFQKARLVQPGELFVPFDRHNFQGFAIIRF